MKADLLPNEPILFSLAQPFAPNQKPIRSVQLALVTSET